MLSASHAEEGNTALGYLWEYGWGLFWSSSIPGDLPDPRISCHSGVQPPDNIFMVALPFKLFGVKYIFDITTPIPSCTTQSMSAKTFFYKTQVWLEKLTYRFSDVIMRPTRVTKHSQSTAVTSVRGCVVVRNGPDLDTFKLVPAKAELKHGKPYLVGYVGT